MASTPCPREHEILPLIGGEEVGSAIRSHVKSCSRCRARLARLRNEVKALRRATMSEKPDASARG
jgi:hypothetical protein